MERSEAKAMRWVSLAMALLVTSQLIGFATGRGPQLLTVVFLVTGLVLGSFAVYYGWFRDR